MARLPSKRLAELVETRLCEVGCADEDKAKRVANEREDDELPRTRGCMGKLTPDVDAPQRGNKRSTLAERVGDGRAGDTRGNDIAGEGKHPDHATEDAPEMCFACAAEVSSVGDVVDAHEDGVEISSAA